MDELNSTAVETSRWTPKEEAADLWKSVLMESLKQGNNATVATGEATRCVKALREQFPPD